MARPKSVAKPTAPPPEEPAVEAIAEPMFEIKVKRVVKAFGLTFRPSLEYTVKAKVRDGLADPPDGKGDAIESCVPAASSAQS